MPLMTRARKASENATVASTPASPKASAFPMVPASPKAARGRRKASKAAASQTPASPKLPSSPKANRGSRKASKAPISPKATRGSKVTETPAPPKVPAPLEAPISPKPTRSSKVTKTRKAPAAPKAIRGGKVTETPAPPKVPAPLEAPVSPKATRGRRVTKTPAPSQVTASLEAPDPPKATKGSKGTKTSKAPKATAPSRVTRAGNASKAVELPEPIEDWRVRFQVRSPTPPGFNSHAHYEQVERDFEETKDLLRQIKEANDIVNAVPGFSERSALHGLGYREPDTTKNDIVMKAYWKGVEKEEKRVAKEERQAKREADAKAAKVGKESERMIAEFEAKQAAAAVLVQARRDLEALSSSASKVTTAPKGVLKGGARGNLKKRGADDDDDDNAAAAAAAGPRKRVKFASPIQAPSSRRQTRLNGTTSAPAPAPAILKTGTKRRANDDDDDDDGDNTNDAAKPENNPAKRARVESNKTSKEATSRSKGVRGSDPFPTHMWMADPRDERTPPYKAYGTPSNREIYYNPGNFVRGNSSGINRPPPPSPPKASRPPLAIFPEPEPGVKVIGDVTDAESRHHQDPSFEFTLTELHQKGFWKDENPVWSRLSGMAGNRRGRALAQENRMKEVAEKKKKAGGWLGNLEKESEKGKEVQEEVSLKQIARGRSTWKVKGDQPKDASELARFLKMPEDEEAMVHF